MQRNVRVARAKTPMMRAGLPRLCAPSHGKILSLVVEFFCGALDRFGLAENLPAIAMMTSPAGVTCVRCFPERAKTSTPSSSSNRRICFEMPGREVYSACAVADIEIVMSDLPDVAQLLQFQTVPSLGGPGAASLQQRRPICSAVLGLESNIPLALVGRP